MGHIFLIFLQFVQFSPQGPVEPGAGELPAAARRRPGGRGGGQEYSTPLTSPSVGTVPLQMFQHLEKSGVSNINLNIAKF